MAIDSAAELLFRIRADSGDAENNVKRFREVLGKDLDALGAEFGGWANSVFGNLSTVKGALLGATAALAAGVVAVGAAALQANERFIQMVEEVDAVGDVTGIAAEKVSVLRFAADVTKTSMGSLTAGLTIYAATASKAAAGNEDAVASFKKLGITQAQLKATQGDTMRLLELTMDGFRGLKNATDQTTASRDLFGRGGTQMLDFLNMGSAGLRKMADEARRLGLIITGEDVTALEQYKAALAVAKSYQEALDIQIGRVTLPLMGQLQITWGAFLQTVTNPGEIVRSGFVAAFSANVAMMHARVEQLAKALQATGTKPLVDVPKKVDLQAFEGLENVLEGIRQRMGGLEGDEAKIAQELHHMFLEAANAQEQFVKLRSEGKLTAETIARESTAMAALPAAIVELGAKLRQELGEKRTEAITAAGEDLRQRLQSQQERGFAQEEAAWTIEIAELRRHLGAKHLLTAANLDLLNQVEAAGREKIRRDRQDAWTRELVELQQHQTQMVLGTLDTVGRLQFQYDLDLAKFSEIEMMKTEAWKAGGESRRLIEEQYALIRDRLLQQYGTDLVTLQNSRGWNAFFGSGFAAAIRNNERLLREWVSANRQSSLVVRATYESLAQFGREAWQDLTSAMAQNAVAAFVHGQSIGRALRQALADTLQTVAAKCAVMALEATAWGFYSLAQHDYKAAGEYFTSAGLFAAVGGAAAVAARFVQPGKEERGGAGGGSQAGAGASTQQEGSGAQRGPRVTFVIQGNVYGPGGVRTIMDLMNREVLDNDAPLFASGTTGRKAVRR